MRTAMLIRQFFLAILLLGIPGAPGGAKELTNGFAPVYLPAPLAPRVVGDGRTVLNGVPVRAVVDDPNPPGVLRHIPAPAGLLAEPAAPSATFSITYVPAGSHDAFGELCFDFPAAARTVFSAAANIWASLITSSVPITIEACWADLGSSSTLGYSGGGTVHRDFSGAPAANTFYSASLANSLHGADLDATNADMHITYNMNFSWYMGVDGNTPADRHDLMTVVLHEIGHGLNFSGSMQYAGGIGSFGYGTAYPNIYDTFMRDGSGTPLTSYSNGSPALGSVLTSNDLWFHGTNAMAANGGQRVRIYAPATWAQGSSYSHLDYDTFNNTAHQLMVYAISKGESIHDPGAITNGLLQDLGWVMASGTSLSTVMTQAVTAIGETTATGNGTITDLGSPNPSQHGVCWNTAGSPTTSDSCTQEGTVFSTGSFTSVMSGLTPNTTYYVRAYATNTAGTAYGSEVSFTTNSSTTPPTVTTQAVTAIGETTATGNGTITDLGSPNPSQHGVCWNTTGSPTTSDSCTQEGAVSATGAFTSAMSGLAPSTTYYVRAYATNTAGTAYGNQVSFTTASPAGATELQNGVAVTGLSGAMDEALYYYITVPAGQKSLTVTTSGGTGDADLYVRFGALPTTSTYDERSWNWGNDETITITNPQSGDWYVLVHGYEAFAGLDLVATYVEKFPWSMFLPGIITGNKPTSSP